MSYILDALTKSQKERKRTPVPTLATEYPFEEAQHSSSKRWTSTTVILLASMAVLIALYALITRPPTSHEFSAAPPQQHSPPESALSTIQSVVTDEKVTPTPSGSSNTVTGEERLLAARVETMNHDGALPAEPSSEKPKTIAPRSSKSSSAEPGSAQKRERVNQAKSSSRASSLSTSETTGAQPADVSTSEPQLSNELKRLEDEMLALRRESEQVESGMRKDRVTALRPGPREDTTSAAATLSASEPDRDTHTSTATGVPAVHGAELPTLRELPPEVRNNLPPIQIIAHAYAQMSSKRMVIINMKRYGEGDRMREGPLIDAITPTGVLLTFEGRQFQVPAR